MKKVKHILVLPVTFVAILFTSCEGEDFSADFLEKETKISDSYLLTEACLSNTFQIIDNALKDDSLRAKDSSVIDGAIVTRSGNIITIDYGLGTIGADGRPRSGFIEVTEISDYLSPGGDVQVNLDHYVLNEINIKGSISLFNYGTDGFTMSITDFMAVDPLQINASKTITWFNGFSTPTFADDIYSISGDTYGQYDSTSVDVVTPTPIMIDNSCIHRVLSGVVDISMEGDSVQTTCTIDFVDNDGCENLAKITLKKGERELILARQFFGF